MDGTSIRLGHNLDASSMRIDAFCPIKGYWDGQRWITTAFFIVPGGRHGMMTSAPTHWLPATLNQSDNRHG